MQHEIIKATFFFPLLVLFCSAGIQVNAQSADWIWAESMGGPRDIYCYSMATDPSGAVYTTGWFSGTADFDPGEGEYFLSTFGQHDIYISKIDGAGNFLWARSFRGTKANKGWSIATDPTGSGDVYLTGSFQGTVDFNPGVGNYLLTSKGDADVFVVRLNAMGDLVWAKAIGGTGSDIGRSLAVDPSGRYVYVTGSFSGTVDFDPGQGIVNLVSAGGTDIFIVRLDTWGQFNWAKGLGGTGYDNGYSISISASGSEIYTTGSFVNTADFDPGQNKYLLSAEGYRDIFISKLDNKGQFVWAKAIGGAGSEGDGHSIAVDHRGQGAVYTTGYFNGSLDFDPGADTYRITGGGMYVSKLDAAGNFQWAGAVQGDVYPGTDRSLVVDPSGNGDVYTTGMFYGTVDFDPGDGIADYTASGIGDVYVTKLTGWGEYVWTKTAGDSRNETGTALALDPQGNIYVGGHFESPTLDFGNTTLINPLSYYTGWGGQLYFFYTSDVFVARIEVKKVFGYATTLPADTELDVDGESLEEASPRASFFDSGEDITSAVKFPEITVYPNPTADYLTLDVKQGFTHSLIVRLVSASGEMLLMENFRQNDQPLTLDLSPMPAGIYFLEMISEGERVVKKIVKE